MRCISDIIYSCTEVPVLERPAALPLREAVRPQLVARAGPDHAVDGLAGARCWSLRSAEIRSTAPAADPEHQALSVDLNGVEQVQTYRPTAGPTSESA